MSLERRDRARVEHPLLWLLRVPPRCTALPVAGKGHAAHRGVLALRRGRLRKGQSGSLPGAGAVARCVALRAIPYFQRAIGGPRKKDLAVRAERQGGDDVSMAVQRGPNPHLALTD